jgi:hypothetical protein
LKRFAAIQARPANPLVTVAVADKQNLCHFRINLHFMLIKPMYQSLSK